MWIVGGQRTDLKGWNKYMKLEELDIMIQSQQSVQKLSLKVCSSTWIGSSSKVHVCLWQAEEESILILNSLVVVVAKPEKVVTWMILVLVINITLKEIKESYKARKRKCAGFVDLSIATFNYLFPSKQDHTNWRPRKTNWIFSSLSFDRNLKFQRTRREREKALEATYLLHLRMPSDR